MLLLFFSLVTLADAVYFTMSNIRVTIPIDKGKFPPKDRPLLTFYARAESTTKYSITNGAKFFDISSTTGSVFFTRNFFETDITSLNSVSARIAVRDSSGKENRTSLKLDILPLEPLDCDFIVEDLCFWKSVEYRIEENTKPTLIGSLASPYLAEMCANYSITYKLLSKNREFRIVSEGVHRSIESTKPLDREMKSQHTLEVLCTVENAKHSIRNVTRTFSVLVLDVDDNVPVAQEAKFDITMSTRFIQKGHLVTHKDLIFYDKDTTAVNKYEAAVLNDTGNVLTAECNKLADDYSRKEVQTAVHCKLKFTDNVPINKWTHSVQLQLNDTTLINGSQTVSVPIHLHFPDESGHYPTTSKRNKLKQPDIYPSNRVSLFRTAALLARLSRPHPKYWDKVKNFTLTTITPGAENIFNVTSGQGIIYLHDPKKLRTVPEYIRIKVSWINNDTESSKQFDEIEVRVVNEPTETCPNSNSSIDWSCAEYGTPKTCLDPEVCAMSTGGSNSVAKRQGPERCMWRGERNPSNKYTALYATCTPDDQTCPDEECDELEELSPYICPQDCTTTTNFPTRINEKTNRGIGKGFGVCTCTSLSCSCNPMKFFREPSTTKNNKTVTPKEITNQTPIAQSNKHTGNSTGRVLGIELAHCGASCILGIGAGVFFLGGAVALVVIYWRVDRVQKAVRNKFSNESQDLSAPLSDYINRSIPEPEPLPLNFDMTTSLADTAILNIINKYAPDPKWEVPRNQLIIEQTLGEGEFGKVLRAKALNISGQSGYTTVAVKTLKDDARESELNDLLSEYQLLKEVSHPNVIRLLGVCTAPGGPIYLIIEFAEHGSLRNYLRRSRHLKSECGRLPSSTVLDDTDVHYDEPNVSKVTPKEILSFAWQICKGMAYLSEIKLVHRDLAARNVLLAADKVCKISDFGLTRDIYEDDAYFKRSKGRVPVKWMAPESLSDHVYTNKSDVWSFGILVWELVTLGATPYPGIAVQNLFHLLKQGYRMERPDNCSPTLYNIMRSCWHIDPEQRPTFQELSALWEKMLSDEVEYLDLANNAIHNRSYFCSPFEESSEPSEKSETNPLNYLSKSQSYMKCGSAEKFPENSNLLTQPDSNQNDINTQGYETPVKVPKKVQTPTNDSPQYYTDMAGKTN